MPDLEQLKNERELVNTIIELVELGHLHPETIENDIRFYLTPKGRKARTKEAAHA